MDKDFYGLKTQEFTNCVNASNIPCWVPQIKDIVNSNAQKRLEPCSSVMDYNCENMILWFGLQRTFPKCHKPCDRLHYKLIEREAIKIPNKHLEIEWDHWVSIVFVMNLINNRFT